MRLARLPSPARNNYTNILAGTTWQCILGSLAQEEGQQDTSRGRGGGAGRGGGGDLALILQLLLPQGYSHALCHLVLSLMPEHICITLLARQLLLQLAALALQLLYLHTPYNAFVMRPD